ncbi:MAG: hypothetical protein QNK64_00020 [Saprospiraceae bacterium]|nr:hypothetical protein [Saprospiraceae bacterium]
MKQPLKFSILLVLLSALFFSSSCEGNLEVDCELYDVDITVAVDSSGAILTANVIDGTPEYNYMWSTGKITSSILVNGEGTYGVTATDGNGCTDEATIAVSLPQTILHSYVIRLGQVGSIGGGPKPPFSTASNNLTNPNNTYYPSTWVPGQSATSNFGDIITDAITLQGASWEFPEGGPPGTYQYDPSQTTAQGVSSPSVRTFASFEPPIDDSLPVGTRIHFNSTTEAAYKYYFAIADDVADVPDFTADGVSFQALLGAGTSQLVQKIAITVGGEPYTLYAMNNSANTAAESFERLL